MEYSCNCSCHSNGGIHFAACCTSCKDCGEERIRMTSYEYHKEKCQFRSIVGMSIEDARTFVESIKYNESQNYEMRIIKVDGKNMAVTCDFNVFRLNVEVKDGLIFLIDGIS